LCWACSVVKAADLPAVEALRHLEGEALRDEVNGEAGTQAFWSRGLVPLEWLGLPPAPRDFEIKLVGAAKPFIAGIKLDVSDMILYLDESGGPHASDPRVRRAGWGLVALRRKVGFSTYEYEHLRPSNCLCDDERLRPSKKILYDDEHLKPHAAWYGTVAGDLQTPPERLWWPWSRP